MLDESINELKQELNELKVERNDKEKSVEQLLKNGLRATHCYSFIKCATVTLAGKNHRVVKLRNPWGHEEWNGASQYRSDEALS